MAAPMKLFPAILVLLVVCHHSKAAVIPEKMSSAQGESGQEMSPHGLDLSNLSLPPEVITEALFSQTDFLQDQLEQCEEMVRNNLKGDDTAETDGIEDEDEDDEDKDDLNRKIAQMAMNLFSHFRKENDDDVNSHDPSKATGHGDDASKETGHDGRLSAGPAASKSSNDSPTRERGEIGDDNNEKNKTSDEESEEYVVYEYDDVAENNGTAGDEERKVGGHQDAENVEDPVQEDSRKVEQEHQKEEAESSTHVHQNQATDTTTTQHISDSEMDTKDSDAEEPQPQPEEVNIFNTVTNFKHISTENSHSPANKDAVQTRPDQTNQDQTSSRIVATMATAGTENFASQGHKDSTTLEPTENTKDGATPPSEQGSGNSELPVPDNNSEESRMKRSLSLEQVVMNVIGDGGMQNEIHEVTFGKGRIRRQASAREAFKESLPQIQTYSQLHTLLRSLLPQSSALNAHVIVGRRRRRESMLGRGSSPERFVPLIEQLVERLNYLQHSVRVCHRLLPPHRLSSNTAVLV